MKKYIFAILGLFFMGLGSIGIILPILPTVPFYLLASYFFMKSSDRMDIWFKETKLYKKHLESFDKERKMKKKTKISILTFVSLMLLVPFIKVDVLPMRIFIIVLLIFKYYYFIFKIDSY